MPAINDHKNKRRRFIQMPPPLAKWLKAYPIDENVVPPDWDREKKAVQRLAGWKVWSDAVPRLGITPKMEAEPPEYLPDWPHNALRDTAATVCLVGFPTWAYRQFGNATTPLCKRDVETRGG